MTNFLNKRRNGFTLAELLIALAVLGVIATFNIVKIFNSINLVQKKSVLKETVSTLNTLTYTALNNGVAPNVMNAYILQQLNAVKTCMSNASTQGCWSGPAYLGWQTQPGVRLHNGSTIIGMIDYSGNNFGGGQWQNQVMIDWNGETGPNTIGDDQIDLVYCYGTVKCTTNVSVPISPGQLAPDTGYCPLPVANAVLYNSIFQ